MSDDTPQPAIRWSEQCGDIFAALAIAQASLGGLVKGKTADIPTKKGGDYSYSYADLPATLAACLGALNARQLSVMQPARVFENGVEVTTVITHGSGQWIMSAPLFMPVRSTGAQDVGSAITYARRYALQAMVGLSPADDDGAAAHASAPKTWDRKKPNAPPKPKREDLGPRCTGKAANIAVAIERRVLALAERDSADRDRVLVWAIQEVGVDLSKYGHPIARAEQLTISDGKLVNALLTDQLGPDALGEEGPQ